MESKASSELYVKQLQLHWLLQVTKAINYNMPSDQLFKVYETVMRDHLKVCKLALFVHEGQWSQILSYGHDEEMLSENLDKHFDELSSMEFNGMQMPPWVKGFESIIPVFHNHQSLAYAFIGDLQNEEIVSLKEILPFIHTITNIIVVAIENKRLTKETINQVQMQKEMELAAKMQTMLFPEHLPKNKHIDLAATYLPHQRVGGDYYDYMELNEHELLVCLADVSGKGMSAALLMSNFQANLHARANLATSLKELLIDLNAAVNKSAKGEKYITVFIGIINTQTNIITYVNAGHNPPIIYQNNDFKLLEIGTTGLGMFDELPFIDEGMVYFPKGAMLFCYTDGFIEQENVKGEIFGLDRLTELLRNNIECSGMQELQINLINEFTKFSSKADALDDVTLLSCRSI